MHLHEAQALLAAIKQEVEAVRREAHGYVWGLLHGAALQEMQDAGLVREECRRASRAKPTKPLMPFQRRLSPCGQHI